MFVGKKFSEKYKISIPMQTAKMFRALQLKDNYKIKQ